MQSKQSQPQQAARKPNPASAPRVRPTSARQNPAPRNPALQRNWTAAVTSSESLEAAKDALIDAVLDTRRGSAASLEKRGYIEELQVNLEAFQGTEPINYDVIDGLWELKYTTADDLIPVIDAENILRPPLGFLPPPIQVGSIYQRFFKPVNGYGKVHNIIQFSLPFVTEADNGITLKVEASYEVRSGHRIRLVFDWAEVSDIRISEGLEALLAPALLPRNPIQQAVISAIRQFRWQYPFRSPDRVAAGVEERTGEMYTGGGAFNITYLDEELLVGRASEMKGIFVMQRVPETQLAIIPSSTNTASSNGVGKRTTPAPA